MTTTELTMPASVVAELEATLDERTRSILERRRASKVVRRRGWLIRRALAGADVVGLGVAFFLAVMLFGGDSSVAATDRISPQTEVLLFLLTLPGWIVVAKLYGLYERDEERTDHTTADDFGGVFHMITVGAWGLFAGAWLTNLADPQLDKLVGFWALAILLVCTFRASARAYCRNRVEYLQNTIIVGAGDVGQMIAKKYLDHPEYGINLVGFVDSEPKERREDLGHLTLLGHPRELAFLVELFDVERVLLAFSAADHTEELSMLRSLRELGVQIDVVPRLFEAVGHSFDVHTVEGLPIIGVAPPNLSRSNQAVKRAFDVVLASVALFVLAPIFLAVTALIKFDSPGPVIYRHRRVGFRARPLDVLKFRTMKTEFCRGERYGGEAAEAAFVEIMSDPSQRAEFEAKYKLTDDPRVTRVGRFLRSTSLDELPQLVNVLKGELSLVGPRALTAVELDRYGAGVGALLAVRPGVTGYWQINGRNNLDYADRVRLDLAYIAGWSIRLDLEILVRTVRVLLSRAGAA